MRPSKAEHRQRIQRMFAEMRQLKLHKALVKTRAWPRRVNHTDELARQSESNKSACDIDPIGSPKRFDEPFRIGPKARNLVVPLTADMAILWGTMVFAFGGPEALAFLRNEVDGGIRQILKVLAMVGALDRQLHPGYRRHSRDPHPVRGDTAIGGVRSG